MPSFAEVRELVVSTPNGADAVRRRYIKELSALTGRPTLLYASRSDQIVRDDVQFFMSALIGVKGDALDLVLHSPGGQAEATEQIVKYLRAKFKHLRVIVPQNAMSAATMLACAANEIVMGKHSSLGPVDPQVILPGSAIAVPAQSIIDEFKFAQDAVNRGDNPVLWVDKLGTIPLGFVIQCHKLIALSHVLVQEWLARYMFAGEPLADERGRAIAGWLSSNPSFLTHGRHIGIEQATSHGLKVASLESDQSLQEAVLSLFHATISTFLFTNCTKVVENHDGVGTYVLAPAK